MVQLRDHNARFAGYGIEHEHPVVVDEHGRISKLVHRSMQAATTRRFVRQCDVESVTFRGRLTGQR